MIDFYHWTTPNGHKISIFLEEAGLPYRIHPVNISMGDQFKPEFLAIAPNNRIPAIVDQTPADGGAPISLFESGAILEYLADKSGQFLPRDIRGRAKVLQWLHWQMGGLGPMAGQNHHFVQYAPEKLPYAIDRTSRKQAGSTEYWTSIWPTTSSSAATTPLPTWRVTRGSCPMNASSRTSRSSRI